MKKRFSNNKGFSLVELIIVVAIMAILIGILAPQYMKYVEKSRLSADNDMIDSVRKAAETALADPNSSYSTASATIAFSDTTNVTDPTSGEIEAIIGTGMPNTTLKSKTYKNASTKPSIVITMSDDDGDGILDPTVTVNNLIRGQANQQGQGN